MPPPPQPTDSTNFIEHDFTNAFRFADVAKALNEATARREDLGESTDDTEFNQDGLSSTSHVNTDQDAIEDLQLHHTFWACSMADFMRENKVKYDEKSEELRVPGRHEHAFDLAYGRIRKKARSGASSSTTGETTSVGDERVRRIREIYTHGFKVRIRPGEDSGAFHYITPSDDQLLFLEACLFATLPKIYGTSEWATHHVRVLEDWGKDSIDYFLMMITARRMGKTFSMSMFNAALALVVPGLVIAVYSTGRRASRMLKEQVEKLVLMTGEANAKRIVQSNQEELFIAHKAMSDNSTKRSLEAQNLRMDPSTTKLNSYPSTVKGKKTLYTLFIHSKPSPTSRPYKNEIKTQNEIQFLVAAARACSRYACDTSRLPKRSSQPPQQILRQRMNKARCH